MHSPNKSRSVRTLRRLGTYHLSQVEVRPELAQIAEQFRATQSSLEAKYTEHEAAVDAVIRASAARDEKRGSMRLVLRTSAHMIRRATGNRRGSRVYQKYFPDGMDRVLRGAINPEIEQVKDILTKLETEQEPLLRDQIQPLSTALQQAEETLRQFEEAVANERRTRALLDSEKQAWIDGYRASHSRLRLHFVASPERAEDFFRKDVQGRRILEEPEEPEEPEVPEEPTEPAIPDQPVLTRAQQALDVPSQTGPPSQPPASGEDIVAEAA